MNIHFVGTGAIGVIQRSACTLIDGKILIDCGNGLVKTIMQQGFDIGDIEVVLITHLHGDHYLDLPYFMLSKFLSKSQKLTKIYCPKETKKKVKELSDLYAFGDCDFETTKKNANIEFIEFEELNNVEVIENYFVNSYEVNHVVIDKAFGYTIENNGKVVGFSGDTIYCDGVEKIVEKSDISVLDLSSVKIKKTHMCIEDIEKICKKYNDKTIVTTHMGNESREEAKKIEAENLIIPNDGDEIVI